MAEIAQGETLLFSSGQYSDYGVNDVAVAMVTFDLHAQLEAWLTAHPEQREHYCFEQREFLAHLMKEQLVKPLPYREVFLGSYGNTDVEIH